MNLLAMHFAEEEFSTCFEAAEAAHPFKLLHALRAKRKCADAAARLPALLRLYADVIAHALLLANREDAVLAREPEAARGTAVEIERAL